MNNPWKHLKPGILYAISKEVQNHKFYWYVEEDKLNPCLRFRIRNQTTPNPPRNKLPLISYISFGTLDNNKDFKVINTFSFYSFLNKEYVFKLKYF